MDIIFSRSTFEKVKEDLAIIMLKNEDMIPSKDLSFRRFYTHDKRITRADRDVVFQNPWKAGMMLEKRDTGTGHQPPTFV